MKTSRETGPTGLTRREMLKLSGLTLGGLAAGGAIVGSSGGNARADDVCEGDDCDCPEAIACRWDHPVEPERYTYYEHLSPFYPFRDPPSPAICARNSR
jgi:ribonuclease Z